jgi:hypothetical protein
LRSSTNAWGGGDFNLARIGDERQRENLARGYVDAAEALRGFGSELELLARARQLAPHWREQLMNQNPAQIARG